MSEYETCRGRATERGSRGMPLQQEMVSWVACRPQQRLSYTAACTVSVLRMRLTGIDIEGEVAKVVFTC